MSKLITFYCKFCLLKQQIESANICGEGYLLIIKFLPKNSLNFLIVGMISQPTHNNANFSVSYFSDFFETVNQCSKLLIIHQPLAEWIY